MKIQLREPRNQEELRRYYDLRWRVLREPWAHAPQSARDEHERDGYHLAAWHDGRIVGAGRLHLNSLEEGQVRYMAVEEGYTGRGIGSLILLALEKEARQRGLQRIMLNARENAVGFYRKHGYGIVERTDTGFNAIIHWRMSKNL